MFAKQCLRTKVKHAHALNSLYVAADGRPHGTLITLISSSKIDCMI